MATDLGERPRADAAAVERLLEMLSCEQLHPVEVWRTIRESDSSAFRGIRVKRFLTRLPGGEDWREADREKRADQVLWLMGLKPQTRMGELTRDRLDKALELWKDPFSMAQAPPGWPFWPE